MIAIEPITEPTVKPTIMETLTSGYTLKQAERKRIDALGKLNDRRLRALAEANKPALLELAAEYAAFGRAITYLTHKGDRYDDFSKSS